MVGFRFNLLFLQNLKLKKKYINKEKYFYLIFVIGLMNYYIINILECDEYYCFYCCIISDLIYNLKKLFYLYVNIYYLVCVVKD